MRIVLPSILTILIFSLWAGFALTVINPYLREHVPGYVMGQLCIWELIALIISAVIAFLMVRYWGNLSLEEKKEREYITIHKNYGIFFIIYLVIAVAVGIWQFWMFTQNFQ